MDEYINLAAQYSGLTDAAANERISMYGYNREENDEQGERFPLPLIFASLRFLMMLIAAVVLFINANTAAGITMVLLMSFYAATELVKRKMCNEQSRLIHYRKGFEVRVIRNGGLAMTDSRLLVPDDIVILQAGESVPADLHILQSNNLTADEHLFTDERAPVSKNAGVDSKNELKQSCVYKGTRLLSGNMTGRVFATGVDTLKYKTFGKSDSDNGYYTSFERVLDRVLPMFSIISIVLFIATAFFCFLNESAVELSSLLAGTILPAASFALCFIPAETVCVVRIYYLSAVKRISKKQMIVKSLDTLESLNAMTAICVDKSGIITKNRIVIAEEYSPNIEMLTNISVLSCDINASSFIDQAIMLGASFKGHDADELLQNILLKSYPFSEEDKIGGNLWQINNSRLLCIKGSPEKIYTVCRIQHEQLFGLQEKQMLFSKQGHQVIAVAYANIPDGAEIPKSIYDAEFKVIGLVSFKNRIRDAIPMAVRNCYKAGVRVVMMTGDSAEAAKTIAEKIGMRDGRVITGKELKDSILEGKVLDAAGVNIFARISPEQKMDIIKLLQQNGEIVGTISDNTADVTLLESADIGITIMQNSSTSVQEASDILISDDDFGDFVDTIKEARQMHSNIKSVISFSLSVTAVLVLFSTIDLLAGGEAVFTALLSSLIPTVIVPVCLLSYINNRSDIKLIQYSSGFIGKGKISKRFLTKAAAQSLTLLIFMLVMYFVAVGNSDSAAASCTFATFIAGILTMMWVNMSNGVSCFKLLIKNAGNALLPTLIILLASIMLVYLPFVNSIFGFEPVNPLLFIVSVLAGIISQAWYEVVKRKNQNS